MERDDVTRLRMVLADLGLDPRATVTRLTSVSNNVFRAGDGDDAIVVRTASRARYGANRLEEARNATNAAAAGLAPVVVHADVVDGTFATRWVDGRALTPATARGNGEAIVAVAEALRGVHALPAGTHGFDPVAVIDAYLSDLAGRHDVRRARSVRDAVAARVSAGERALCHNDPWPGNVVMVDGVAMFVDWEYSGLNDPAWDLADFVVEAGLDREDEELLLQTYATSIGVDAWRDRVASLKPAVDVLWSLWSIAEFEAGNPADDFLAEAERRLHRAERALDG